MVVSEAVEGEPGELCGQLADQPGELKTELFSLQLEDVHEEEGRSGGDIVVDCLGVIYALPHTGHTGGLLLIRQMFPVSSDLFIIT